MIFVLDDQTSRVEFFRSVVGKDNVDYAESPDAAFEKIRDNRYRVVFLDHDLGGAYTRGPLGDGIDLAKRMVKEGLSVQCPIVIHSLNYDGAMNMYSFLKGSYDVCIVNMILLRSNPDIIRCIK